jgi:transposase
MAISALSRPLLRRATSLPTRELGGDSAGSYLPLRMRRAEFFRKRGAARDLVGGKRWLLLSSWLNLDRGKRRQLNALFALNRRILKAYLLKESLTQLWNYTYEKSMLRYLQSWIDQLRWQRLKPMEKLARMLLDHLEGILNYCRTKVPMGVIEAVNGNIKALLRAGAVIET